MRNRCNLLEALIGCLTPRSPLGRVESHVLFVARDDYLPCRGSFKGEGRPEYSFTAKGVKTELYSLLSPLLVSYVILVRPELYHTIQLFQEHTTRPQDVIRVKTNQSDTLPSKFDSALRGSKHACDSGISLLPQP
jgi:hypothetical protein